MKDFCVDNQKEYKEIEEKVEDCQSKKTFERNDDVPAARKKPEKSKLTAEERAKYLRKFEELFNRCQDESSDCEEEVSEEEPIETCSRKKREVIVPKNASSLTNDFMTSHKAQKKPLVTWKLPVEEPSAIDSDDSDDDVIAQNDVTNDSDADKNVIRFKHSANDSCRASDDGSIRSPADVPSKTKTPKSILKKPSQVACDKGDVEKPVKIPPQVESRIVKDIVVERRSNERNISKINNKKKRPSKFKLSQLK